MKFIELTGFDSLGEPKKVLVNPVQIAYLEQNDLDPNQLIIVFSRGRSGALTLAVSESYEEVAGLLAEV